MSEESAIVKECVDWNALPFVVAYIIYHRNMSRKKEAHEKKAEKMCASMNSNESSIFLWELLICVYSFLSICHGNSVPSMRIDSNMIY